MAALCRSSSTRTLQHWASCALASQKERQPEGAVGLGSPSTTSGFMSMRCRKARAKARLDTDCRHLRTSSSTCGRVSAQEVRPLRAPTLPGSCQAPFLDTGAYLL